MDLEPRNTFAKILWKYYGYTLPDPPQLMAQKLMNWLADSDIELVQKIKKEGDPVRDRPFASQETTS